MVGGVLLNIFNKTLYHQVIYYQYNTKHGEMNSLIEERNTGKIIWQEEF